MQKKKNLRQVGPPIQHDAVEIRAGHSTPEGEPMFLLTLTGAVPEAHKLLTLEEIGRLYDELGRAIDLAISEPKGKDCD